MLRNRTKLTGHLGREGESLSLCFCRLSAFWLLAVDGQGKNIHLRVKPTRNQEKTLAHEGSGEPSLSRHATWNDGRLMLNSCSCGLNLLWWCWCRSLLPHLVCGNSNLREEARATFYTFTLLLMRCS